MDVKKLAEKMGIIEITIIIPQQGIFPALLHKETGEVVAVNFERPLSPETRRWAA